MTHEELLNHILANACPSSLEGNKREFRIETHCVTFVVTADLVSPLGDPNFRYGNLSVRFAD